jgi:hypothetical protein
MLLMHHCHYGIQGGKQGQPILAAAGHLQPIARAAPLLPTLRRRLVVTSSPAAFRDDADVIPSGMDDDEDDEDHVAV